MNFQIWPRCRGFDGTAVFAWWRNTFWIVTCAVAVAVINCSCRGSQQPPGMQGKAAAAPAAAVAVNQTALVNKGRQLYLLNCAHCHASDATGDEGPDLHGVRKSDLRITSMIKNGVKGEMPRFGAKLTDSDIGALIAFLRSLPS